MEEKEDSGGMKKWQSPGVKYWLCDGSWKRKASLGVALGGHEEAFHPCKGQLTVLTCREARGRGHMVFAWWSVQMEFG